ARNLLGLDTRSHLPNSPLDTIGCRHTVGLADPIRSNEVPTGERLHDGLPQALDECIQFYGLRYFKVKVCGDHDQDLDRLGRMADLFNERCPNGFSISLDGNEQYRDLTLLNSLLEALRSRENGERFVENVLYIEQPLGRDLALDASAASGIAALSELRPVIIDESDDLPDSFERATKLGYRGTSHKNCKGIFKSLRNLSLAKKLNTETGGENYFLSAEDLANTAVLPLQQDLSTVAALGIPHAERNGHHYFRCLDHLPRDEAEETAAKHESLYTRRGDSIGLDVTNGLIDVSSLRCAGYGYASRVDVESRTPLDEWDFAQLGT
ncbi:MAG: mandelate racemase, partial [Planctomycetota bacterium]